MLSVHTVWDLGWNDAMTIIMVQRHPTSLRIIDYIEDSHYPISHYVGQLAARRYHWGTDWLPHDARRLWGVSDGLEAPNRAAADCRG